MCCGSYCPHYTMRACEECSPIISTPRIESCLTALKHFNSLYECPLVFIQLLTITILDYHVWYYM